MIVPNQDYYSNEGCRWDGASWIWKESVWRGLGMEVARLGSCQLSFASLIYRFDI